jgi:hypothetical protein
MAITHIATVSATPGVTGGTTAAIDTTGADLIVVSVSSYAGGMAPTLTDSKGNTYTGLTARLLSNAAHRLFYVLAPTVGAGHTFTVTGATLYPAIVVDAFAGVASYQTESGATATSIASLACGSVTPSTNGALVVTGAAGDGAVTDTVSPAGFTLTQKTFSGGNNMQGSAAWQVQATAAAINPTWSFSPAQGSAAVGAAVFVPAAAPSGAVRLTTLYAEALTQNASADLRLTGIYAEALTQNASADVRLTALFAEALTQNPSADIRLTSLFVEVLATTAPAESGVVGGTVASTAVVFAPTVSAPSQAVTLPTIAPTAEEPFPPTVFRLPPSPVQETQASLEIIASPNPDARLTTAAVDTLRQADAAITDARTTQAPVETLRQALAAVTDARLSQAVVEVIYPFGCYTPKPPACPPGGSFPIDSDSLLVDEDEDS